MASQTTLVTRLRSFAERPAVVTTFFLLPFLTLFVGFRVWPTVHAVVLSFQDIEGVGSSEWTGLGNYQALAQDPQFYKALTNSALYALGTLVLLIVIPFTLAAVLHSGRVKNSHGFRTLLFLPVLTSLVVVGVVFQLILSPEGLINAGLGALGLPALDWLESEYLALPALLILATWRWVGLNILYFTTGLANIPQELYDAAAVDGASGFRRFLHISLPLSKPIILFVMVLTLINGFQLFVEPFILWTGGESPGGGGLSIVILLYRTAFTSFNLGYAAAIGVVLALIILVISAIQLRLFGFFKKE